MSQNGPQNSHMEHGIKTKPRHPALMPPRPRHHGTRPSQLPPVVNFPTSLGRDRAISISEILRTGEVTILPDLNPLWRVLGVLIPSIGKKIDEYRKAQDTHNYTLHLETDDAFTRSVEKAIQAQFSAIDHSPVLQDLLQKPAWRLNDRALWEQHVGTIASREMHALFGRYRTEGLSSVKRTPSLNDLSSDLDNNEEKIEFDCEATSIVKGIMMQLADDHFLPPQVETEGTYKIPTSYYYVTQPGHAFLVSPTTMNVIEGEQPLYFRNVNPWLDFHQFAQGEPIVILPHPEDPHSEYGAYGMLEGAGKLFKENALLRSLQIAEFLSQRIADYIASSREVDSAFQGDFELVKEEWITVFRNAGNDPQMILTATDSFERNFLNRFKASDFAIQDRAGRITTLGESVVEWAHGAELRKPARDNSVRTPALRSSERLQIQPGQGSLAHLFEHPVSRNHTSQRQPQPSEVSADQCNETGRPGARFLTKSLG